MRPIASEVATVTGSQGPGPAAAILPTAAILPAAELAQAAYFILLSLCLETHTHTRTYVHTHVHMYTHTHSHPLWGLTKALRVPCAEQRLPPCLMSAQQPTSGFVSMGFVCLFACCLWRDLQAPDNCHSTVLGTKPTVSLGEKRLRGTGSRLEFVIRGENTSPSASMGPLPCAAGAI